MSKRQKGKRLSESEEKQIIDFYRTGIALPNIMKECECGSGTVYSVLRRNCIDIRDTVAEYGKCKRRDFFSIIDREEKAYFLGLYLADGSAAKINRINISLQEQDKYILERLAMELGMSPSEVKFQKEREPAGPQARLSFCSRSMRRDMAPYGFIPNKVKSTFLPSIPEDQMSHFIRGLFDGDGHVSKYIVYICGTERLCTEIKHMLASKGINTYLYEQKNTNVWYVKGLGKEGRTAFLRYLYKDATIFLSRKREKAFDTHLTAPSIPRNRRKLRELLETPEEDNQQPSLESNLSEGSTTSSYGPSGTMKDHERGAPILWAMI
jgi:hypothetical protein